MTGNKAVKCARCRRRYRAGAKDADRWNAGFSKGYLTGVVCPDCQTPEENAEAEINDATLDYSKTEIDMFGRLRTPHK
jgi:hypothetical protein